MTALGTPKRIINIPVPEPVPERVPEPQREKEPVPVS